jgi:hypothetical protein
MHPIVIVVVLALAMGLLYAYGKKFFVHVRGHYGGRIPRGPTRLMRRGPSCLEQGERPATNAPANVRHDQFRIPFVIVMLAAPALLCTMPPHLAQLQ